MRKRNESLYRETTSKNGTFSTHVSAKTAARIRRYCALTNINKTKFVEDCINKQLDALERECLDKLTKEELIALVLKEQRNEKKNGTDKQMALPI